MSYAVSGLAQAKPALTTTSSASSFAETSKLLSEKLHNFKMSSSSTSSLVPQQQQSNYNGNQRQQPDPASIGALKMAQMSKHLIEDERLIQRQNASNQMRQAAVLAAVVSQQKVRLSATERLALSAKRPLIGCSNGLPMQTNQATATANQTSSKPTSQPMPTLETLLAVQRQLQQHTRQHLSSAPQVSQQQQPQAQMVITRQVGKPLPPSPPLKPQLLMQQQYQQQQQHRIPAPNNNGSAHQQATLTATSETYEKELPPLPVHHSVSPSSGSSDESQLNSLDSQSSPANSLVSIPPPPPPISCYLDEVSAASSHSPSCSSYTSEASSVIRTPMSSMQFTHLPLVQQQQQQFPPSKHQPLVGVYSSLPPPPPPLLPSADLQSKGGFDEPDCGELRFPTPPPPDLLLGCEEQEEECAPKDDEDFQCRIPTPPRKTTKAMEAQQQQQQQQQSSFLPQAFSASSFSAGLVQPPALFRQNYQQHQHKYQPMGQTSISTSQLTVRVGNHQASILAQLGSASPCSSSDGDNHSSNSNSSSSTSGIHSSIDSPSSSNSKLDDFNYALKRLAGSNKQLAAATTLPANNNGSHQTIPAAIKAAAVATTMATATTTTTATRPARPALKQKKSVSFSDKVELVACAEEQCEERLPNPLLARVLAGKLQ